MDHAWRDAKTGWSTFSIESFDQANLKTTMLVRMTNIGTTPVGNTHWPPLPHAEATHKIENIKKQKQNWYTTRVTTRLNLESCLKETRIETEMVRQRRCHRLHANRWTV